MNGEIGKRIALLMNQKGYTQRELALRTNVNETTISRYINGSRVPNSEILANLATVLGTTSNYLLGKEEEFTVSGIKTILAKNASHMTEEEKKELIDIIRKG